MGKVANHIRNLAMQAGTNFISSKLGFASNNNQDAAKVAAKLATESPFKISADKVDPYRESPLKFARVKYPLDLGNDDLGHYIIFYTIFNRFASQASEFKFANQFGWNFTTKGHPSGGSSSSSNIKRHLKSSTGKTVQQVKTSNSVLSNLPQNSTVTSAVSLYMPPNVSVSYGANWQAEETELSGTIATALGNVKTAEGTANKVKALAAGVGGGAMTWAKQLAGGALSAANFGDPVKLASKYFGVAINPHEEVFYEGPEFRSFDYTFDFYPRNQKEMTAVNNIIKIFKYHMHPQLDMSRTGGRLFYAPSEYEIHYAYKDQENEYLNKISRCALKKVDVKYGNEGVWSALPADNKGAHPVHTNMALTFQELEFMTKKEIAEGF